MPVLNSMVVLFVLTSRKPIRPNYFLQFCPIPVLNVRLYEIQNFIALLGAAADLPRPCIPYPPPLSVDLKLSLQASE